MSSGHVDGAQGVERGQQARQRSSHPESVQAVEQVAVRALGHREVAITGGADLQDRRNRRRRTAVRGHRLVLAEVLDMLAEPDDGLPAVQDERVRL
jgi:hypothetical protein